MKFVAIILSGNIIENILKPFCTAFIKSEIFFEFLAINLNFTTFFVLVAAFLVSVESACNTFCYQLYSPVCGVRYNSNYYYPRLEFKTFGNSCQLNVANCQSPNQRWTSSKSGYTCEQIGYVAAPIVYPGAGTV